MKKFTFAALAACLLLAGCGNNGSESASTGDTSGTSTVAPAAKTPAEKTAAVLEAVELPEMAEVTAEKLLSYYGINEADVTEFSAYVAGAGVYPDEFGVFTASDAEAAERINEAIAKRIDKQYNTYKDYSPDEMYKFDDYILEVEGTTVIYAVCADNEAAAEALNG